MADAALGHLGDIVGAMSKTRNFALGLTGLLLTTACATTTGEPAGTGGAELSKVVFLGDSVAAGEALPLAAAFEAGGVEFQSLASDGGGNVVGPFAEERWKELPGQLGSAEPGVVVYQITSFDWGNRQEQQAAYDRLLATVTGLGAELVFVTMPPIQPDDFYQPHMADLDRAPEAARAVAAGSSGRAHVLDAAEVWGSAYQQDRDGKPDRSDDGVHTCPQGAARFTNWLLGRLAELYPGFTPADPRTWANTGWAADTRFKGC